MFVIKIAICQTSIFSDKETMIHRAKIAGAEVVLFPELVHPVKTNDYGVVIGSGYEEKKMFRNPYNTYEIDYDGHSLLKYRKQHLFPVYDEGRRAEKNKKMPYMYLDSKRVYVCICYDLRFLSVFSKMEKPDIIIVAADFPTERIMDWCRLLKLRALQNQCIVIGVNTVGGGYSMVVNRHGDVITEAGNSETILLWEMK